MLPVVGSFAFPALPTGTICRLVCPDGMLNTSADTAPESAQQSRAIAYVTRTKLWRAIAFLLHPAHKKRGESQRLTLSRVCQNSLPHPRGLYPPEIMQDCSGYSRHP